MTVIYHKKQPNTMHLFKLIYYLPKTVARMAGTVASVIGVILVIGVMLTWLSPHYTNDLLHQWQKRQK